MISSCAGTSAPARSVLFIVLQRVLVLLIVLQSSLLIRDYSQKFSYSPFTRSRVSGLGCLIFSGLYVRAQSVHEIPADRVGTVTEFPSLTQTFVFENMKSARSGAEHAHHTSGLQVMQQQIPPIDSRREIVFKENPERRSRRAVRVTSEVPYDIVIL